MIRLRSIGDAVLMTPLLAAFERAIPGVELTVALEPTTADLLRGQPCVHDVLPVGRGVFERARVIRELRRGRFDLALDLHGGPTAALLTALSGARRRVGLDAYRHPRAYDHRISTTFKGRERLETLHTVESNLAIAEALGLEPAPDAAPRLRPTPAGEAEATAALTAAGAPMHGYIALHPGAALASKTWPWARFAAVATELAAHHDIVLIRSPPDAARARHLHRVPELSLAGLTALLARARLFIGNDSGPAHMAAAVDVSTIAVFGSQDPRVWRPYGAQHHALVAALDCHPCRGFDCANPHRFLCLDRISTDDVLTAARTALARAV